VELSSASADNGRPGRSAAFASGIEGWMQPFVINSRGRMMFASDFRAEILRRIEAGEYSSRR
jgi:hypothetical protein